MPSSKEEALSIEWGKGEHKLAQNYEITDASAHDNQVFDELLDHAQDVDGDKRAAYADSAYRSKNTEEKLAIDQAQWNLFYGLWKSEVVTALDA